MTPEPSFESLSQKLFSVDGNLTVNAELDPDVTFFENISFLHTQYFSIDDAKIFVNNNISSDSFSRSVQINFKKFQEFFKTLKLNFSAVYLSETWCDSLDSTKNSNYRLHGYKPFHQTRDGCKRGGLCIFLSNTLSYKIRSDLSMNSDAIECLCLEILTKTSKNLILSLNYRPPKAFCKSTSHIPANIPHPEHPTSRTSHLPNIPHPQHHTSPTYNIWAIIEVKYTFFYCMDC